MAKRDNFSLGRVIVIAFIIWVHSMTNFLKISESIVLTTLIQELFMQLCLQEAFIKVVIFAGEHRNENSSIITIYLDFHSA